MTKKVSDWLADYEGHGIYNAALLQAGFEKETGKTDILPSHTVAETRELIANDHRGGGVRGAPEERCIYGYELAPFLAEKYGTDENRAYRGLFGRGFRFRAALESITQAGN